MTGFVRPAAGEIPAGPGVYRWRDARGQVIYVGKARSLRQRLTSYFADPVTLHPRTRQMVATAASVDWVVVANEVEALSLEYSWIKEYDPRFNVKYRDDKSYPYLSVTVGDEFPRAAVVREAKRPGSRYFGPYSHAWAIRETVDELTRVFPIRTCRDGVFRRAAQVGRPCLLGYIDKCSAPCVGRIDEQDYRDLVDQFCAFLDGRSDDYIKSLDLLMRDASAAQDYEAAARWRDRMNALQRALERNTVVFDDSTDADVIAIADDDLQMGVQVFHVRGGRIRGERGFVMEKAEDLDSAGWLERVLQRLYGDATVQPAREVLIPVSPQNGDELDAWMSQLRGSKVTMRIPVRGDKRTLMETAARNAQEVLRRHSMKRSADLTARSEALAQLQEALSLPEPPLRIECIDISTLQGQDTVASLVVFEDGLPRTKDYRSFVIRDRDADDTAAVAEVVSRRFREQSVEGSTSSFGYPPGLLVIDGGAPQVRAAQDALMEAGRADIPVIGLAKRLEEVWLPNEDEPLILSRSSEGLYLLQRVRDEAHRRAIGLHRTRRDKKVTRSALDDIPGLGPQKRTALLRKLGSVRRIRAATVDELQQVPGIGPRLAAVIHERLNEDAGNGQG